MAELLARLRAVLRRAQRRAGGGQSRQVTIGRWQVDLPSRLVTRADAAGPAIRPGRDAPADADRWAILENCWSSGPASSSARRSSSPGCGTPASSSRRTPRRFHMAHLRRKLEGDPARPRYVLTEPGMGYRYQPQDGPVVHVTASSTQGHTYPLLIPGAACQIHVHSDPGGGDALTKTGRIWLARSVPGTRGKRLGRDPSHKTPGPGACRAGIHGQRHAGPLPGETLPVPVWVVVASATRRSYPSSAPGAAEPWPGPGLRAAGVTNGQSDGGALEPFH